MSKKYYEAYNERYKKAHSENLKWFGEASTPELIRWLEKNNVSKNEEICEIGCGEGRDCLKLAEMGYRVTGIDISEEAIRFAKEEAKKRKLNINLLCLDATELNQYQKKYKVVYSIATLHMLVLDEDRHRFLKSLHHILEDGGKCLLVNMGDGKKTFISDHQNAFDIINRYHYSGEELQVTSTTCRIVDYDTHLKELKKANFIVLSKEITQNNEYGDCMTMELTK